MNQPIEHPRLRSFGAAGAFFAARWPLLVAALAGMLVLALGLQRVRLESVDFPAGRAWLDHLARTLVPLSEGRWAGDGLLAASESPWTRLLDAALLAANGQWDPVAWALASILLHALGAALVVHFLFEHAATRARGLAAAVIASGVFAVQAISHAPREPVPAGSFLVIFLGLQLVVGTRAQAFSVRWWSGWGLGVCSVLAAPMGALGPLALAVREARGRWAAGGGTAAGGRRGFAAAALHAGVGLSGLLWLLVANTQAGGAAAGAWAQVWFGDVDARHAIAVVAGLFLVLSALSAAGRRARAAFLAGGAVAAIAAGAALNRWIDAGKARANSPPAARLETLRTAIRHGDMDTLGPAMGLAPGQVEGVAALLADVRVRALLPPTLRDPLALQSESPADATDFRAGGVPAFPRMEIPPGARGTFGREAGEGDASFASRPVATRFPIISFFVSGELAPPATSLELRLPDGRMVAPMQATVRSPAGWRRVNFANPGGPFIVVAHAAAGGPWLAFSDPVELGWLARYATKALGWIAVLWAGAAILAAFAAAVLFGPARVPPGGVSSDGPDRDTSAWAGRVLPWLALLGYVAFLAHHLDLSAGGSDSSGYRNSARLLGAGVLTPEIPRLSGPEGAGLPAGAFVPPGFTLKGDTHMAPTYPVGVPLMYAAAGRLLPGDGAVGAVVLLHLLMGVLVTRALARAAGLEGMWAWAAAMIIGLCPVYYFMGVQAMSDAPAMVWATTAVWAAWRSRERARLALVAGLATAVAVLVRPSNMLIVLPVVVLLGFDLRRLGLWILGGLPGGAWQAFYAWTLYGDPLTTGYGNIGGMFDFGLLGATLESYGRWWTVLLSPVVWLMLAFPLVTSVGARLRLGLALWALVYAAFYATYVCTYETWWYQRFLLPAMPAMVVMALLVVRSAAKRLERTSGRNRLHLWHGAAAASVIGMLLLAASIHLRTLYFVGPGNHYETSSLWLARHVPEDAVVIAGQTTGALYFYTKIDFLGLHGVDRATLEKTIDILTKAGRPVYASIFSGESEVLAPRPDEWRGVAAFGDISIWKLEPGASPTLPGPGAR